MSETYIQLTRTIERLHRRLLDVIRLELSNLGVDDINAVQALMLTNLEGKGTTVRDLVQRGYYLGSNASYNIKHLVEAGYVDQERSSRDRRAQIVRLTKSGETLVARLRDLDERNAETLAKIEDAAADIETASRVLRRLEGLWSDYLRYADF
ncbi:MAG: MarR family winged helix-turn-helix transcriptional regulator [Alphaproteobacteria bacterium]